MTTVKISAGRCAVLSMEDTVKAMPPIARGLTAMALGALRLARGLTAMALGALRLAHGPPTDLEREAWRSLDAVTQRRLLDEMKAHGGHVEVTAGRATVVR